MSESHVIHFVNLKKHVHIHFNVKLLNRIV